MQARLLTRPSPAADERFRWVFGEQRMIVVGEASEVDEALLHRDLSDGDRRGVALPQNGMNGAQPLVAQERHGSEAKNVVKRAMQTPPRDVEMRADFRNVDGPGAGLVEIILNVPNQLYRRWQWAAAVGWQ